MSTHPYIPLYVDDYDAATAHLTVEEDGAYSRLIRLCWRTPGCSLPDDAAWIARKIRLSADDFERIARPVLVEFFKLQRGRWVQKRLKAEYDDISRKKTARKLAGKKGGEAKSAKSKDKSASIATDLPEDTRAFPEPEPEPEVLAAVVEARAPRVQPADDWPDGDARAHADFLAQINRHLDTARQPGLALTIGEIARWRLHGFSWLLDVFPAIEAHAARPRGDPIQHWKYFTPAIERNFANRTRPVEPLPQGQRHERHDTQSSKFAAKQRNLAVAAAVEPARRERFIG